MEQPASIEEAARRLRAGELTCAALARACLERVEALQPGLNAFITVTSDAAMARAQALDRELRAGADRGPLHGIPIVCKDCLDTAGARTTMGSRLFASRVPAADAEVLERLAAAGAVMLGKTNMNEFAAGTSGKNMAYGDVRNPWALDHSAGGSSSGTAAAVAAGIAPAGVGTDTGGSIRIPAACTGTVGMRPTLGRVSGRGCFPRSYSFDTVAPLARSAHDCALMFAAMAGEALPDLAGGIAGTRIGVIRDFSLRGLDAEVEQALRAALADLAALGASVREVIVPAFADVAAPSAAFLDVMLYEFHQVLDEQWRRRADREELFGPVVRANLERGAKITEKAYQAALALRESATAAIRAVFSQVDVLATPVLATPAPTLDAPPEAFDRQRHFMSPFSLAGLPAISLPCGFSRDSLPIGMQLVADRLQEKPLFRITYAYEAATDWHKRLPQRP
jgi:aspartyl-tRNA(Asn)/glutamyl-tRNA(Gln) amidotransferase subunit A